MGERLTSYRQALDYLFARTTGAWRFGLERTRALLTELGEPERQLRVIHVGGTNGKGSVCATLDRVLRDRGFRVGRYTSPHLVDFRERVVIDGVCISEDDIVSFIRDWTPAVERIGATFFEATTAMAFTLLARAEVDVAIIEVGLGGRLDATNVVDPMCAVVTSIGRDHTEYLGDTLGSIAWEKAGIFKADRPAVIGERDPGVRSLLATHARTHRAAPIDVVHDAATLGGVRVGGSGTVFTLGTGETTHELRTSLIGQHQALNTLTALRTLEALPPPYRTTIAQAAPSLGRVHLAGRFDVRGRYILDVAHNADGARVFAAALAAVQPPRPRACVLSVLRDKEWPEMMAMLAPYVDTFVLTTAPTSPAHRAWDPGEAQAHAAHEGWNAIVEKDFAAALRRAESEGQVVLITGSFHTVGDAMACLHLSPHGD